MSRTLVFAPEFNTKGRKDATGAFIPEAKRFCDFWELSRNNIHLINNKQNKARMREDVLDIIDDHTGILTDVVFFCHGFKSGWQLGFRKKHVSEFVDACSTKFLYDGTMENPAPMVTFYSCDVARDLDKDRQNDMKQLGGDGGLCDEVRDELCRQGYTFCRVVGHSTAGHTDKNPYCKMFDGKGSPIGGIGGEAPVYRGHPLWKQWIAALKTDFRFEFPWLTIGEIHETLINNF